MTASRYAPPGGIFSETIFAGQGEVQIVHQFIAKMLVEPHRSVAVKAPIRRRRTASPTASSRSDRVFLNCSRMRPAGPAVGRRRRRRSSRPFCSGGAEAACIGRSARTRFRNAPRPRRNRRAALGFDEPGDGIGKVRQLRRRIAGCRNAGGDQPRSPSHRRGGPARR